MRSCPVCQAELSETAAHCARCAGTTGGLKARRIVFRTRKSLKERYETLVVEHGLSLRSPKPLAEGAEFPLHLVLPEEAGTVTVTARVARTQEVAAAEGTSYQLHLQLLDFDEEKHAMVRAALSGAPPAPAPTSSPSPPRPAADEATRAPAPPPRPTPDEAARPPAPPSRPAAKHARRASGPAPLPRLATEKSSGPPTRDRTELQIEGLLEPCEVSAESALVGSAPERAAPRVPDYEPPGGKRRIADELTEDLSEFTIQFVQALTKTSYYTSDHREAERAKAGLYGAFATLLRDKSEVTFYLRMMGEKRAMLVYGVFDEPTELSAVMRKEMAEIYTTKFSSFFDSNSLLSISLKRALDDEEFHRFVDLLARPGSLTAGAESALAETLARERIHHISLVLQEDRVAGRRLSWRVQMALTRLRKDLSVIPFYRDLSKEALEQVRMQVFGDVIRPLRDVAVLRELLENCDLALEGSEKASEEKLADLEGRVLMAVEREKLPDLLQGLADDLAEARDEGGERFEMLQRLTRRVSEQLAIDQAPLLENAFRTLLANEVLARHELPAFMQEKLALEDKAEAFLNIKDQHLGHFEGVREPADYQRHLDFFGSIFPILLHQRDPSALLEILERVTAGRAEPAPFEERAALVEAWLEQLVESKLAQELPALFEAADRVRREFLLKICRLVGEPVLPTLFSMLRASELGATRQELHEFLVDFKEPVLRFVSRELQGADVDSDYLRELLGLLEQVGQPDSAPLAAALREHHDPQVRKTALRVACSLDEGRAEEWLVPALVDPEAKIRNSARGQLFKRRSTAPAVFEYCSGILSRVESDPDLARHICTDLAVYEEGEGRRSSIALLLGVLASHEAPKGGWLSKLTGGSSDPDDVPVLIAACLSLGRMGATEAEAELTRLCKCGSRSLEQAASRALKMIQQS